MEKIQEHQKNLQKLTVGIDISQNWADVHVHPIGHVRRFLNTKNDLEQLSIWLKSYNPSKILCEYTGGLERLTVQTLEKSGLNCIAVNPNRINAFRIASAKIAKTDLLDAELIAVFAEKMEIVEQKPLSPVERKLKDLAARRRQLVEMQTCERNRLKRCLDDDANISINNVLHVLHEQRAAIEAQMLSVVERDEDLRNRMEILVSVPGVGKIVALTLLSEMPELGSLNEKQAASLAGLAPHNRDSGVKTGRNSIKGGRKCVRAALYSKNRKH